jgi:hypothetical protein
MLPFYMCELNGEMHDLNWKPTASDQFEIARRKSRAAGRVTMGGAAIGNCGFVRLRRCNIL